MPLVVLDRLPDIRNNKLMTPEDRRQVVEYLYALSDELRYTLNNLDAENLSDELESKLLSKADVESYKKATQDLNDAVATYKSQLSAIVSAASIIKAINASTEDERINPSKIETGEWEYTHDGVSGPGVTLSETALVVGSINVLSTLANLTSRIEALEGGI